MPYILFVLAAIVALAIGLILHVWRISRSRSRISSSVRLELQRAWQHTVSLPDPVRRVMEAEKVADRLLSALGFSGSFADKLKAASARFGKMESVWSAHKLRNRLAHEPGATIGEKEATNALAAFEQLLKPFLRK